MRDIKIIGGGSAGWMSAATLISQFPNKQITLIESPNIATVGVGESTIAHISNWMSLLGIKDEDFMSYCNASYKLAIRFENFYRKDSGHFYYPFGEPLTRNGGLNDWYFKKFLYPDTPVSDYADSLYSNMALVNQNKMFRNENRTLPFNFKQDSAYHFDATKFGQWLKEHYCLPRGVKHILSEVKDVKVNDDVGVEYIVLDDGSKIKADLFIDCTGSRALLIDKALKEPFNSFEDALPNNSAWSTKMPYTDKKNELVNYTNCSAIGNGWVWTIPLWSRIGTGYVYSDKYISDDDALKEFKNYLKRKTKEDIHLLEYKKIRMRCGIHKRIWVKNVCAIGMAAGFIEPLESSGLYTVHQFLLALVRTLQRDCRVSQWDRDVYNTETVTDFLEFMEFVSIHFALSHRDDTEYWRDIMNRSYSKDLTNMEVSWVGGFVNAAFSKLRYNKFKSIGGLHCIATGMHWFPIDFPTVKFYNFNNDKNYWNKKCKRTIDDMNRVKEKWNDSVKSELSHYDFLKENYYRNNA